MRTLARGLSRAVTVLVLATVSLLAGASIRSLADTPGPNRMQIALPARHTGFTDHPDGALLDTTRLAPGTSTSGVMGIRNTSSGRANLYLKMVDVTESDGCRGRAHCPQQGRLRIEPALTFAIDVANSRDGSYHRTWSGSAAALRDAVRVSTPLLAAGVRWVRLSATLAVDASNDIQSETLHFGLKVALDSIGGESSQTLGTRHHTGRRLSGLSVTGTRLQMITALGLALVGIGLIVIVAGHRRNGHSTR